MTLLSLGERICFPGDYEVIIFPLAEVCSVRGSFGFGLMRGLTVRAERRVLYTEKIVVAREGYSVVE